MEKYNWKHSNITKKNAKFLDNLKPDLKFTGKEKYKLKDAILYGQKICPELVLEEYRKTAQNSLQNTTEIYNYMILDSLRLKFEKNTSFAVLSDVTENNKTIIATTTQAHSKNFNIFNVKTREYFFTGIGETLNSLKCGINENKIFIAYHNIYSKHENIGLTPGMIMRLALQRSGSINDVMRILASYPHAKNSAYFVVHKEKMLVFQTANGINKIIYPKKYFLSFTNHFMDEMLSAFDLKKQMFPENTSVQRDAHVAYFLMQSRRNISTGTVKRIFNSNDSDICSNQENFSTEYALIYEYPDDNVIISHGPPQNNKYKRLKLF